MTNLAGGSEDDVFLVSGEDNGATIDGGAGYDVLTIDYRTMDSPQVDLVAGTISAAPRIPYGTGYSWDFANPRIISFSNIERINLQFYGVTVVDITPSDIEMFVQNDGGFGRIDLSYSGTSQDHVVDFAQGGPVKTIGNVSFTGFTNFGFTGGSGNDVVTGSDAMDFLFGGDGDDVLDGGGGDGGDLLSGGTGNDVYIIRDVRYASFVTELADGGIDEMRVYGDFMILPSFVENLVGMADTDQYLAGNALANFIRGGNGSDEIHGDVGGDTLEGGAGNDRLYGDNGNDIVAGGSGDDYLEGGAGIDTVSFEQASAAVMVSLAGSNASGEGSDTIVGFENIRGSAFNDDLTGDGGANILSGLGGADRMTGLDGDDQYWVDAVGDQVMEAADGGYDTVFAKVDYTLPDHVEALTLIGRGNIDGYGNALDNVLTGNAGNNRLQGFDGEDVLIGGAGDDICHVNSGGDRVIEAAGEGKDLIVSSRSIDLLTMIDVENVRLVGSRDLDVNGNAADNELQGNAGDNILRGFGGHDLLTGGAGRDIFGIDAAPDGASVATITDFVVGEDRIDLVGSAFAGLPPGALQAGMLGYGDVAQDADDRILYDGSIGALFYDPDGSGAAAAVQFAVLAPGLALRNADFWVV